MKQHMFWAICTAVVLSVAACSSPYHKQTKEPWGHAKAKGKGPLPCKVMVKEKKVAKKGS